MGFKRALACDFCGIVVDVTELQQQVPPGWIVMITPPQDQFLCSVDCAKEKALQLKKAAMDAVGLGNPEV